METRTYGIYIVKDSFSLGRVTGFIPQSNDIVAMYSFKDFLENEENRKKFPILKKLELIKLCTVDQITDRVLINYPINVTVCNALNIDEYIKIHLSKCDTEEVE